MNKSISKIMKEKEIARLVKDKTNNILKVLIIFSVFISFIDSKAGALDDLVKFTGADMANITTPHLEQDQLAGHLSGGSAITRGVRPRNLQPLTITPPSIKFDPCTGSGDFRFGSLSYIKAPEFSRFLKSLGRALPAYGMKLAIKTISPINEDIMSELEAIARDINNFSLNQCSMAKSIAAGALQKGDAADKLKCMMYSAAGGIRGDIYETTSECSTNPRQIESKVHRDQAKEAGLDSLLGDEFNLVWKALNHTKSAGLLRNFAPDAETISFREMLMSLSGTIIVQNKEISWKDSLLKDQEMIKKFVGGDLNQTFNVYACDDKDKCLNPNMVQTSLNSNSTFFGKVRNLLKSINEKMIADANNTQFTDDEKFLIEYSFIPVLNLIEGEIVIKGDASKFLLGISEFIEAVSIESVVGFMDRLINYVALAVKNLGHSQLDSSKVDSFIQDIDRIRKVLREEKTMSVQRTIQIINLKQKLEQDRKIMESNMIKAVSHSRGK